MITPLLERARLLRPPVWAMFVGPIADLYFSLLAGSSARVSKFLEKLVSFGACRGEHGIVNEGYD